jgi:hypothetical protein
MYRMKSKGPRTDPCFFNTAVAACQFTRADVVGVVCL